MNIFHCQQRNGTGLEISEMLLDLDAPSCSRAIESGSFVPALQTLLVSMKDQNLNKYTTPSTWRDYWPCPQDLIVDILLLMIIDIQA